LPDNQGRFDDPLLCDKWRIKLDSVEVVEQNGSSSDAERFTVLINGSDRWCDLTAK
jgi:hypothetical protein